MPIRWWAPALSGSRCSHVVSQARVAGECRREIGCTVEEQRGLGDSSLPKGDVPEQEVGLRIIGERERGGIEFDAGGSGLIHAVPQQGHHHPGWRHRGVLRSDAVEDLPAPGDIAVAEPADELMPKLASYGADAKLMRTRI